MPLFFLLLFEEFISVFTVLNVGIVESGMQSALATFKLGFDPSLPCRENIPAQEFHTVVYTRNILTKYWVSATRISRCDRLTEWPVSLQSRYNNKERSCQALIYPKLTDSRVHLGGHRDHCQSGTFWSSICMVRSTSDRMELNTQIQYLNEGCQNNHLGLLGLT